jgi:anaerobic ribonucleoside-triphosphate reductase activating protein
VSGGEPFEQPKALLDLLAGLDGSELGRIVFTGRTLEDLQSMSLADPILARIDALLAGPYVASLHVARGLLGSANKQAHFLTPRYAARDLEEAPRREVILHADGTTTLSGIDPLRAEPKRPGQEDAESLGPSDSIGSSDSLGSSERSPSR